MRDNFAEDQRNAFNLLLKYPLFENLILLNYPFEEEWIFSYLIRNRHLDLGNQISFLNRNENLKVDWVKMYNSQTGFLDYSSISSNKIACNALTEAGISITFRNWEWEEKLPESVQINDSFDISDLSKVLEGAGENGFYEFAIFESKAIWDHCFKDFVDKEMIDAWAYKDYLNKEVIYHYKSIEDNKLNKIMERIYESNEIAQGEYNKDDNCNEDNIIDEAFEGDPENIWNID